MDLIDDAFVVENNIIKTTPNTSVNVDRGLGYEIFTSMKIFKDNIAQFLADEDGDDTYDELFKRCVRCALKMRENGLKKGDIISISSYNHKDTCVPLLAAILIGVIVAPLDSTLTVDDTVFLLRLVTPKRIFFSPDAGERLEGALRFTNLQVDLTVFGQWKTCEQFSDYLQPNDDEGKFAPEEIASSDEIAMIFFSSGTTGLPKGVCISHRALIYSSYAAINYGFMTSVSMTYARMFWISGPLFIFSAIFSGTSRVVAKLFTAESLWRAVDKYKVSYLFLAPFHGIEMCRIGRPEGVETSSLTSMIIGGSVMALSYLLQLRELLPGTVVSQIYGQTENAGPITFFKMNSSKDLRLAEKNPDSCGRPLQGICYKVLDLDTGEPLGPDQKGELRIKSYSQLSGFYNGEDPEENAWPRSSEAFDEDGWLITGDYVYYDEDYCFYYVERLKQLIKYRNIQIAPALVESILQQHPAVKMAIVIGVPHEEDGEHPMAVIKLNEGFENINPIEIIEYAGHRVHDSQRLRGGVLFVDAFPMTPSGKVRRYELRKIILNQ